MCSDHIMVSLIVNFGGDGMHIVGRARWRYSKLQSIEVESSLVSKFNEN